MIKDYLKGAWYSHTCWFGVILFITGLAVLVDAADRVVSGYTYGLTLVFCGLIVLWLRTQTTQPLIRKEAMTCARRRRHDSANSPECGV